MQSFNITDNLVSAFDRSKLNAIFLILTDNLQRAFNDIDIKCSSLTIKQSSVHLISSRSNAAIRTLTAFYLIAMKLNATVLTSHSIVSASDDIDIK